MKYIKKFETLLDQNKILVYNKIYDTLLLIGHEVNFNPRISYIYKNVKINSIYIDNSEVIMKVNVEFDGNEVERERTPIYSASNQIHQNLSLIKLKEIENYLKQKFPYEYKNSIYAKNINKYNL